MRAQQTGSGSMAVFRGYRSQYGAGLGNVLSGLLRQAVPLVAPAVKNIGKTLISAGANKLQDVIRSKLGPSTPSYEQQLDGYAPRRRRKRKLPIKRKTIRRKRPVK